MRKERPSRDWLEMAWEEYADIGGETTTQFLEPITTRLIQLYLAGATPNVAAIVALSEFRERVARGKARCQEMHIAPTAA